VTTFVLATANANKADEMRAVVRGLNIELLARPSTVPDVDETEDTLEGNALLKARALVEATGHPALADDTGLFVDALMGRPGVYSARYAGVGASDEDNVRKLLSELDNVLDTERRAHFRTVICAAYAGGDFFCVEGVLEGTIARKARGEKGFGYDSVFIPDLDPSRTLAEMTSEEKNAISHRARALRALADELAAR
jgi:XTP/dITP diphosphohydrolase